MKRTCSQKNTTCHRSMGNFFYLKKVFFLQLCLVLGNTSLIAQPSVDSNWNSTPIFFDDFIPPRSPWDSLDWRDKPNEKWVAHLAGSVTSPYMRMVYQKENAIFNYPDSTMRLRSVYTGLLDTSDYTVPRYMEKKPEHSPIHYKSGAITAWKSGTSDFLYGYFEIRCKLPVNRGAFPAFWLWNETPINSVTNYREIDIFEYCWGITNKTGNFGTPRYYEGQIYYYNGAKPADPSQYRYGNFGHYVPTNVPDLTGWHTFGVEWSPRNVRWYFDNKLVNSYVGDSVPAHGMSLIINNGVNKDIDSTNMTANFPNEMIIDYVKVNRLLAQCSRDTCIKNNAELNAFTYRVYKSIIIGGYGNSINIPANTHRVYRATENITINGPFELPLGSSMELMTHPCPQ
jgi:beta-glucanase (GH16 family)